MKGEQGTRNAEQEGFCDHQRPTKCLLSSISFFYPKTPMGEVFYILSIL